jgi:hypothetical protein
VDARASSDSGRHSRFSRNTKSVEIKTTPSSAITTPAIWRSSRRWSCRKPPMPVAVTPRAMNMTENERQNSSAGPSTLERPRPACRSAIETPEMVER